jgi:hypothetical protein
MKRVLILAEGQTEEAFCNEVLRPHFAHLSIHVNATRIATSVSRSRREHRGGHGSQYSHIEADLRRLLGDTNAALVTTMIDYYALPHDFPGLENRPAKGYVERVAYVEAAWTSRVNNPRFLPHLTLHEFEALMFVGPDEIGQFFNSTDASARVQEVCRGFQSPEEIDEGRETCASRRLIRIIPEYVKRVHGPILAANIGLSRIRAICPHFNQWLTRIEALADSTPAEPTS